jgi:hypothetical protein
VTTSTGLVAGAVMAAGSVAILVSVSDDVGTQLAALALMLVYGIYVGMALVRGNTAALAVEALFALVGLSIAVLALQRSSTWLFAGYLLHGFWDLLHHLRRPVGTDNVPRWYVPACVLYDWAIAAAVLATL